MSSIYVLSWPLPEYPVFILKQVGEEGDKRVYFDYASLVDTMRASGVDVEELDEDCSQVSGSQWDAIFALGLPIAPESPTKALLEKYDALAEKAMFAIKEANAARDAIWPLVAYCFRGMSAKGDWFRFLRLRLERAHHQS